MTAVLWLFALQGALGGFDTLYFHEYKARLPALGEVARRELRLHGARSVLYAVLFATLPYLAWHGLWAIVLGGLLATEIVLTLADFVVEDTVRKPLGGVYPGERVMHAIMGLVYGAALAHLIPVMAGWIARPTLLAWSPPPVPGGLRWLLAAMSLGVLLSGLRDLAAAARLPHSQWPWSRSAEAREVEAR